MSQLPTTYNNYFQEELSCISCDFLLFCKVPCANSQYKTFNATQGSSCGTYTREFYTFFMLTSCAPEVFSSNYKKTQLCHQCTQVPKSGSGKINMIIDRWIALYGFQLFFSSHNARLHDMPFTPAVLIQYAKICFSISTILNLKHSNISFARGLLQSLLD